MVTDEQKAEQEAFGYFDEETWVPPIEMDPECVVLCKAINEGARKCSRKIRTIESCCGHGDRPYWIFFIAESMDDLPWICFWMDGCHTGCYGWRVIVSTDCAMSPVVFLIEGPTGEKAYEQSKVIAERMNDG